MKYYIIFFILKLVHSYPYYYYPQQLPNNYQQQFYQQRYSIPSYYNNYHYHQPCNRCDNQKNGIYMTSQQQYENSNNNYNIPKYASQYQRSPSENGYNNDGYLNNQMNIPYQSTYLNNLNKNNYNNFNSQQAFSPIQSTDSSTSIPFINQRTLLFDKDHQEINVNDDKKITNSQQLEFQISNPSHENDNINKFEISQTTSGNEFQEQVPISTPIIKDIPLETGITNTSHQPINNENEITRELPITNVEKNFDSPVNNESKINEKQTSVLVDSKKDIDYVLYQEVTPSTNNTKNGESDFYDSTIITN